MSKLKVALLLVLTGIGLSTTLTGCFFEEDRGGGGRGYGRGGYQRGGDHGGDRGHGGYYDRREWR
ncbi:MAG TPA: hypothetical protein VGD08_12740 [Stellaceae bacterium]